MSSAAISGEAGQLLLAVVPIRCRTSITRAWPQVCESGTFSVVTSLVPRRPYFASYSPNQVFTSGE